ncbi:hypothetical protein PoB_000249000 [Plakobranchus ocellatus]|uniref:Uncharacterized protein n=1 Tax=Plakobranchus ocellatus TaxID=259542 RepID=A0AAV3XZV2_9GAST|nr:hypothetical protein PoB_000249000 [Plakobranchus ocellatus]
MISGLRHPVEPGRGRWARTRNKRDPCGSQDGFASRSLWAVVNNAGVTGQLAPLEMCTRQDMLDVCHVNLFGPVEVTRVFLPYLRQSRGRVVNVVSVMGRFAAAPGPYCASKFGMEAVSDVLRRELAPHGVKVSLLEPGYFRTPLIGLDALMGKLEIAYKRSSPDVVDAYGGPSFMDRAKVLFKATHDLGSPNTHEVADAFVDALTSRFPRARYLVGWDAKFVFVPLSYMPEWLGDSLRIWFQNFLLRKSGFDA